MLPLKVVLSSGGVFWRISAVLSRQFTQFASRTPSIKGNTSSTSVPANLKRPSVKPIPVALSIVMGTNVSRSSNLHSSASTRQASSKEPSGAETPGNSGDGTMSVENKAELVAKLTPLQYHVTQEAGTERPFTGKYNKFYEQGTYICVVCSQELFSSDTKYDSGCGWPAFNDVLDKGKVTLHADGSLAGRMRTEVRCSKCGAHMGHVFEDGPPPTRKRYCINSASIEFMPAGSERKDVPKSS